MSRCRSALLCAPLALLSCVSIEDGTPPQSDGSSASPSAELAAGGAGSPADLAPETPQNTCNTPGWSFLRVGALDQAAGWDSPTRSISCGAAPSRLTASAPRLGVALRLDVSPSTGRIVEATYVTTGVGPDCEEWGEYEAAIDVASSRLGRSNAAGQQPFELEGVILGPYGVVPIAVAGCASLRAAPC